MTYIIYNRYISSQDASYTNDIVIFLVYKLA